MSTHIEPAPEGGVYIVVNSWPSTYWIGPMPRWLARLRLWWAGVKVEETRP